MNNKPKRKRRAKTTNKKERKMIKENNALENKLKSKNSNLVNGDLEKSLDNFSIDNVMESIEYGIDANFITYEEKIIKRKRDSNNFPILKEDEDPKEIFYSTTETGEILKKSKQSIIFLKKRKVNPLTPDSYLKKGSMRYNLYSHQNIKNFIEQDKILKPLKFNKKTANHIMALLSYYCLKQEEEIKEILISGVLIEKVSKTSTFLCRRTIVEMVKDKVLEKVVINRTHPDKPMPPLRGFNFTDNVFNEPFYNTALEMIKKDQEEEKVKKMDKELNLISIKEEF